MPWHSALALAVTALGLALRFVHARSFLSAGHASDYESAMEAVRWLLTNHRDAARATVLLEPAEIDEREALDPSSSHFITTHSQPLTPDSLEFLVNYCGLQTVAVPRLHPYPVEAGLQVDGPVALRLNHMTCGGQDFAVLARKL